jgi:hypothetical protein
VIGRAGARIAAWTAAAAVAGFLAVTGLTAAPPALAWWSDTGNVTSGTITTWGITNVRCPVPAWGSNHVLSWEGPTGSRYTVTITSNPEPSGLSSWTQATPRPGRPWTATDNGATTTQVTWGIISANPLESTNFTGTWRLTATPPDPTGGWTATRTGTWQIDYRTQVDGVNNCTVDP